MEQLLLKVLQAAEAIEVSRSRLYELIAAGEIEVVRIGRSVRVPRTSLEEYVRRLRGVPAGGTPGTVSRAASPARTLGTAAVNSGSRIQAREHLPALGRSRK